MNHLTDEILNRYIDNELDIQELNFLNEHIKKCQMCLQRLKAQKVVEQNLKRVHEYKVPENFTDMIMKQIAAIRPAIKFIPKKSYFLRFIFVFLGFGILSIIALGLYEISLSSPSIESPEWYKGVLRYVTSEFNLYSSFFRDQTISIIGAIFTFILLISAYFVYDSHKSFKNRVNNLR